MVTQRGLIVLRSMFNANILTGTQGYNIVIKSIMKVEEYIVLA